MRSERRFACCCVALTALAASTGCTKKTLLRDYTPTLPPNSFPALAGKTVCLPGFQTAFNYDLEDEDPTLPESKPPNYEYVEISDQDKDRWEDDLDKAVDQVPEARWVKIGTWGMHLVARAVHAA